MPPERQIAVEIACCQEFALYLTQQLGTNEATHTEYILLKSRELFEKENIRKHAKTYALKMVSSVSSVNNIIEEIKKIALKSKYMLLIVPDEFKTWEVLSS